MATEVLHQPRKESFIAKAKSGSKTEQPGDNADNRIVGRTAWDVVSDLTKVLRRPIVSIPISLGIVTGITLLTINGFVQVTYGKDGWGVKVGAPTGSTGSGAAERGAMAVLEKIIAAGRVANRPYILDDVTVLIRMEDVTKGNSKERQVNWRIIYTIRALQPISKTDKLFKERYSTAAAHVRRWFGTEKEIKSTDNAYNIMLDIPAGETRTIITGATFIYSLPLENNRTALGENILLTSDREFYSYPNEEDVIGELTILIESDTLDFNPVGQAAKRSRMDGSIAPDGDFRFNSVNNRRSLSARWKDVMPNEEVGLHFKVG